MLTDAQFEARIEGIRDTLDNSHAADITDGWGIVLALNAVTEALLLLCEQVRAESKRPR